MRIPAFMTFDATDPWNGQRPQKYITGEIVADGVVVAETSVPEERKAEFDQMVKQGGGMFDGQFDITVMNMDFGSKLTLAAGVTINPIFHGGRGLYK